MMGRILWIGAHQEHHQVGARRMGNPGLGAGDPVEIAFTNRPRRDRREVGPAVGFGEHRSRQYVAGRDLRQPSPFLLFGAGFEDQLRRDLGAGRERTHADIAARKLLRDHARRLLAEPKPAPDFRHTETEYTELGELRYDIQRDAAVGPMPRLRLRYDLALGKFAHLVANGGERFLEPALAGRHLRPGAYQFNEARAARLVAGE